MVNLWEMRKIPEWKIKIKPQNQLKQKILTEKPGMYHDKRMADLFVTVWRTGRSFVAGVYPALYAGLRVTAII